ncbi:MAG TPA: hypothetical protein DD381_05505 [Lentisphaeria bacterium]|nr:MAG: hypothetical protein A2X47_06955 [Lentisphaerae bacterium GWF2_38_69]HBM15787.1 hypothetical protein [Lentisphaeria bacterium]
MPYLAKNGSNQHKKEGVEIPHPNKVLTLQDVADASQGKTVDQVRYAIKQVQEGQNPEPDIPVVEQSKAEKSSRT